MNSVLNITYQGYNDSRSWENSPNDTYFDIMNILHEYVLPVIIALGILGNITSIWVFSGKDLRKSSSSVYVVAVLISDTGFLISSLGPYMEMIGINLTHKPGWCHVIVYLAYVCSFLSVWYVVCITVENYITICHPTRINTMCTVFRARLVVVILAFTSLLCYSVTVIFTKSQNSLCHREHGVIWRVITYTDSILTLLLPSLILATLLAFIISSVLKRINAKRNLRKYEPVQQKKKKSTSTAPQVRVATMLFVISFTVFIMTVPSHVIRLRLMVLYIMDRYLYASVAENFVNELLLFLYQASFAIKVFIFLTFSENFRNGLINNISCLRSSCRSQNRAESAI